MLLLRYESKYVRAAKKPANTGDNMLATMLNTIDVGGEIANILFQQGWTSVLNTAITSSTTWKAVANSAVSSSRWQVTNLINHSDRKFGTSMQPP